MLGKRLIKTSAGAACTTDTVQILDGVPFQSIATYELDGDATNLVETGYINKAGVFNGSSSRINLPSNPINGLSSVSFSFWIKPNDIASYQYVLSFINSVDGWNGLGIRITNTGKIQVVRANSGAVTTTENSTTTLSLNVWQHVAVSVQQSGAVIYINGSPDGTFSSTPFTTNNTGSFDIGMNEYASGATQAFTNGSIDQVRIFNRVITANEVTTLYGETSASSTKSTTDIFADSSALALYEFEGNANDTGGTYNGTATNVVYNEYDGTASNVTYSTGKFGQAAVFNGSSSYIDLGNNSSNNNSTFSVSLWFNTSGHSSTATLINNGGANSQETGYFLGLLSSGYLRFNSTGVGSIDGSVNYADGNWHNVVMTLNNGAYNIYVDGNTTPVISGTGAFTTTATRPTWIGKFSHSTANIEYWDGKIDQVRIYDKAISAADVTTLYNETVATASTNITLEVPSLVAYYKMNDATDETGSYDGTPTNVNFNVAGKFGNAGEFNGSSSSIDTNYPWAFTSIYSISFWAKTSTINTRQIMTGVLASSGANASGRFGFGFTSSNTFEFYIANGSSFYQNTSVSSISYQDNQWHNYIVVVNGTSIKLYVDGNTTPIANLTSTVLGTTSSDSLFIGKFGAYPGVYFNGSIDQVRIFDKAITANEVTTLYNEVYCQPTIVPTDHFNPVLYTGTGSGSKSVTGVGFEPDLVWGKARNAVHPHVIFDIVRGENKQIQPNETSAEVTRASDAYLFDPDGFTVTTAGNLNNAFNYVAWNWKAGGAAVSNTDGTITSQVSANTDAGFSIVSYTGNQTSSTIGHGLSQAPEMIIAKSRSVAQNWAVYHKDAGSNYWLQLNGTIAKIDEPVWNDTTPTDSVFSMNANVIINKSGSTNIAYCFHSVDGMSKIGSYVGTGASGNSIVTGFRPAFLIVKRTDSGDNWLVFDNKRNTTNPTNLSLIPNSSAAESVGNLGNGFSFLSNGFQVVSTDTGVNANGGTYIFMAFAEENVEPQPVLANSFNTVTYTGNGSTQAINTVGFQPDLVWIKKRGPSTGNHLLQKTIQGAGTGSALSSNSTGAAGNFYQYGYISALDTNGFTIQGGTSGSYPHDNANENNSTYVAWNWKASNESTINQEGSITSIVSANPAAGFSVVKYTGTGSNASFGHGLSSLPELVIVKRTNASEDWFVLYDTTNTPPNYMKLNTTAAGGTSSGVFPSPATSTVVNVGNDTSTNSSGSTYIAYCFHSIDNYQKVGSFSYSAGYSENVGFEPRFLLMKKTSSTGSWYMIDNKRVSGTNNYGILANSSAAEDTGTDYITFTSTGFTTTYSDSGTYIYLAIK